MLAEPSSGARRGPNALRGYPYLLAWAEFAAAHRPDVIVSAGPARAVPRPARVPARLAPGRPPARHVVIAQGPGRWADPARTATDVASGVRLAGRARPGSWLASWQRADAAARGAADEILDARRR